MSFLSKKYSLFNRLSGSIAHDSYDSFEEENDTQHVKPEESAVVHTDTQNIIQQKDKSDTGELPVDVFQTQNDIIIHAFVAGVRPDELNVSISRDIVVVEGSRSKQEKITDPDYFVRELFWGSFAKSILLPQEVDVENASAHAKDGLLTITLPKLDRKQQTKLRVKSG